MDRYTVQEIMQNFREGTRVKGAWGFGTVQHTPVGSYPKDHPSFMGAKGRKFYVKVRWDNGVVTQRQLIAPHTLTLGCGYNPNMPTAWCPECEIDEMIFYRDDYICAWCREMLER